MADLPPDLLGHGVRALGRRQADRLGGVCGRAESVGAHVRRSRGLAGGPSRGHRGRRPPALACRGVSVSCQAAGGPNAKLASCEGSESGYRFARSKIMRGLGLEQSENPLGAVGGPDRDQPSVGFTERLGRRALPGQQWTQANTMRVIQSATRAGLSSPSISTVTVLVISM